LRVLQQNNLECSLRERVCEGENSRKMVEPKKDQPSADKQNHQVTTLQNEVNKALAELAIQCMNMGLKKKYKATIVSKLFARTEMPFTKQVTNHQLPNKFKVS
jgi:hypothetical protein